METTQLLKAMRLYSKGYYKIIVEPKALEGTLKIMQQLNIQPFIIVEWLYEFYSPREPGKIEILLLNYTVSRSLADLLGKSVIEHKNAKDLIFCYCLFSELGKDYCRKYVGLGDILVVNMPQDIGFDHFFRIRF